MTRSAFCTAETVEFDLSQEFIRAHVRFSRSTPPITQPLGCGRPRHHAVVVNARLFKHGNELGLEFRAVVRRHRLKAPTPSGEIRSHLVGQRRSPPRARVLDRSRVQLGPSMGGGDVYGRVLPDGALGAV